jgi:UDP-N-acetylmuramate dehydrogenase
MAQLARTRRSRQPLELPSAGSAFKRPEGTFAAKLIDEAGLKGLSVGGARVSEKHAGFIVNAGGATASDIIALMDEVKRRVKESSGIELELEIKVF